MKFDYAESGDGYLVELSYKEQKTSSRQTDGGVSGGVNKLLKFIQQNPGKRTKDFTVALGQPRRTIERGLKQLRDQAKIEFRGAPKTGGYYSK